MSENPYSGRFWLANDESEHAFGALSLTFKMANDGGGDLHMQLSYLAETAGEVRQEIFRAKCHFHSVITRARAMANEDKIALQTHVLAGLLVSQQTARPTSWPSVPSGYAATRSHARQSRGRDHPSCVVSHADCPTTSH
jgi:hypothetical protein